MLGIKVTDRWWASLDLSKANMHVANVKAQVLSTMYLVCLCLTLNGNVTFWLYASFASCHRKDVQKEINLNLKFSMLFVKFMSKRLTNDS